MVELKAQPCFFYWLLLCWPYVIGKKSFANSLLATFSLAISVGLCSKAERRKNISVASVAVCSGGWFVPVMDTSPSHGRLLRIIASSFLFIQILIQLFFMKFLPSWFWPPYIHEGLGSTRNDSDYYSQTICSKMAITMFEYFQCGWTIMFCIFAFFVGRALINWSEAWPWEALLSALSAILTCVHEADINDQLD